MLAHEAGGRDGRFRWRGRGGRRRTTARRFWAGPVAGRRRAQGARRFGHAARGAAGPARRAARRGRRHRGLLPADHARAVARPPQQRGGHRRRAVRDQARAGSAAPGRGLLLGRPDVGIPIPRALAGAPTVHPRQCRAADATGPWHGPGGLAACHGGCVVPVPADGALPHGDADARRRRDRPRHPRLAVRRRMRGSWLAAERHVRREHPVAGDVGSAAAAPGAGHPRRAQQAEVTAVRPRPAGWHARRGRRPPAARARYDGRAATRSSGVLVRALPGLPAPAAAPAGGRRGGGAHGRRRGPARPALLGGHRARGARLPFSSSAHWRGAGSSTGATPPAPTGIG